MPITSFALARCIMLYIHLISKEGQFLLMKKDCITLSFDSVAILYLSPTTKFVYDKGLMFALPLLFALQAFDEEYKLVEINLCIFYCKSLNLLSEVRHFFRQFISFINILTSLTYLLSFAPRVYMIS